MRRNFLLNETSGQLEILWRWWFITDRNVSIYFNGQKLYEITHPNQLTEDNEFILPNGSKLNVQLWEGELTVHKDGKLKIGRRPYTQIDILNRSARLIMLVGLFSAVLGIAQICNLVGELSLQVGISALMPGIALANELWGSGVVWLLFGIISIFCGIWAKKKSVVAFLISVLAFSAIIALIYRSQAEIFVSVMVVSLLYLGKLLDGIVAIVKLWRVRPAPDGLHSDSHEHENKTSPTSG